MSGRPENAGHRCHASRQGEEEALYCLEPPERFYIWAGRHYLWSAQRRTPVPEFVVDAFETAGAGHLYYALDRVLVCLLAAPATAVVVHEVRCPCLARHERALVAALASLSWMDEEGYRKAMTGVMLPSAACVCESAMRLLAAGLQRLDSGRLAWLTADDEIVRGLLDEEARVGKLVN